jgi:hypothetical protein
MRINVIILPLLAVLLSWPAAGQIAFSTAIEPALNAPARFGVSVAVASNVTENNALSTRFGSGPTLMPGYTRKFIEFLPGIALYGDIQAAMTYRQVAGQKDLTRIAMYGAGVATGLGNGFSVSYGLHINKIAHVPMYPSVYVSVGWSSK